MVSIAVMQLHLREVFQGPVQNNALIWDRQLGNYGR